MASFKIIAALALSGSLAACAGQRASVAPAPAPAPGGTIEEDRHQQAARARLRAVLRDQSFFEHLPESQRAETLSEPFSGRMLILYLVDDRGAARGARASDLAEAGVTREALRAVVEWNLAKLLAEPVSCTSHAITEPAHHQYYESSRLLLDQQWAALAARVGTVVVAAPSNDALFVACNPTPDIVSRLAVAVQNAYPKAPRPVSPSLLTWTNEGWREFSAH